MQTAMTLRGGKADVDNLWVYSDRNAHSSGALALVFVVGRGSDPRRRQLATTGPLWLTIDKHGAGRLI